MLCTAVTLDLPVQQAVRVPMALLLAMLCLCCNALLRHVSTPERAKQRLFVTIGKAGHPQGTSAIIPCDLVTDLQAETSEVHISDFDYDTISWMLRYMYGCLELSPQNLSHAKVTFASAAGQHVLLLLLLRLLKLMLLLLLCCDCTCNCCCSCCFTITAAVTAVT